METVMKSRFEPNTVVRGTNKQVKLWMELLKKNGEPIWRLQRETISSNDVYIVFSTNITTNDLTWCSVGQLGSLEDCIKLNPHDFIMNLLKLKEGDGLNEENTTPEQRKQIVDRFRELGVRVSDRTSEESHWLKFNFGFFNCFDHPLGQNSIHWTSCYWNQIEREIPYWQLCENLGIEKLATQEDKAKHEFYTNKDKDAPDVIKDQHDDVVLDLCKVCNKAEADLAETCPGKIYTEEQVRHIIDLTWGFAYEDWQVPSIDGQDYILHLLKEGKNNTLMKNDPLSANEHYHNWAKNKSDREIIDAVNTFKTNKK